MKVLVTGAYGQLGRELCRQLGRSAIPTDCDTLDFNDGPGIRRLVGELRPDVVINCAAYTQVDQAEKEPDRCRAVNATAVAHFAAACRATHCPLVQVSTDYVFAGGERREPWKESDPPAPRGVYAITKFEGEEAARTQARHWIVRTCGLYARPAHAEAKNFVKTMLRLGRERPRLRVVNDQLCTPSYVPHVARAIRFLAGLLDRPAAPWGTYHVVNGGQTSWYDFAAEIFRQAGMKVAMEAITTAEYAAPAPRPAYSVLDTTAYHALGGPTMPSWQAALAEYFAELRAVTGGGS